MSKKPKNAKTTWACPECRREMVPRKGHAFEDQLRCPSCNISLPIDRVEAHNTAKAVEPKPTTRVRRTEGEVDADQLCGRMGDLLTQTANALKGKPKPLHLHDWSDLPRVAAALRRRVLELEREVKRITACCVTQSVKAANLRNELDRVKKGCRR